MEEENGWVVQSRRILKFETFKTFETSVKRWLRKKSPKQHLKVAKILKAPIEVGPLGQNRMAE